MTYLLDTDTCVAILRGKAHVLAKLGAVAPADCAVSTVTVFELSSGVEKCARASSEQSKVDALLGAVREVVFDRPAAKRARRYPR